MSVATYTVEVAWTGRQTGIFTLGTSTLDGTDVLGGYFGGNAFDDISSVVKSVAIRRGRASDIGPVQASTCTLVLRDTDGTYNPSNSGSSLYADLVPMRPVRVRATFDGTTYGLFRGFIRRISHDPDRNRQESIIECIDLLAWLARTKPTIASTGATTTGAAIGEILDAIYWTETAMRDLDTGDSISDFSADGTKTALVLIEELLDAERGMFYVDADGVAVYEDRAAIYRSPRTSAQSTISGVMRGVLPAVDLDAIRNRATVTRTGGTAQTANDSDSQYAYAVSDWPSVDTSYLPSDAAALSLAQWMVEIGKDAVGRAWQVDLANSSDALLTAILSRDLLDRVTIEETVGGTEGDYHLQGIEHRITHAGKLHEASWVVAKRPAEAFILGTSTIDSTDVLVY